MGDGLEVRGEGEGGVKNDQRFVQWGRRGCRPWVEEQVWEGNCCFWHVGLAGPLRYQSDLSGWQEFELKMKTEASA